jgi:ADP-ribose pyrophosphatase YjhB (NUDIX family)
MPENLDPAVVAGVTNSNFKVLSEATSFGVAQAGGLAAQNAASHQNRVNVIAEAFLAESVLQRAGVDPTEAAAAKKVTESDLARTLADLAATVAQIQQMMKGAQTTRPETGAG